MQKNGSDLFAPPTPAMMGMGGGSNASSSSKSVDHTRGLWSSGIAGDADVDLFTATSHVMRMGASPLIGGDFLLDSSVKTNRGRKSIPTALAFKAQSPDSAYSMDVDDSNESYELEMLQQKKDLSAHLMSAGHHKSASSAGTRRKKPFVSPDSSSSAAESSVLMHSAGSISSVGTVLSPHGDGSASVEKLSVAVKNHKFGVSSMVKPTMAMASTGSVSTSGRRLLKPQHSVLEKSDLSQYFGTQRADETVGDDSNGSAKTSTPSLVVNTAAVEVTVCNCKKSKCLKLYCDCFAVMNYCSGGCNCYDCCNTTEREHIRLEAIRTTKERNASAFQTKINERDQHSTGCHCKNSQCLKKYCECYTGGAFCGQNCKCLSCLNYSGSVDLVKARTSAKDGDGPGSSSRKRKESPSSVAAAFLDATPPADPSRGGLLPSKAPHAAQQAMMQVQAMQLHLSPDLTGAGASHAANATATKSSHRIAGAAAQRANALIATPVTGVSSALLDRSSAHQPHHLENSSSSNNFDMQQPNIKRGRVVHSAHTHTPSQQMPVQSTPVDAMQAGRQLRSRKGAPHDEDPPTAPPSSLKLQFHSSGATTSNHPHGQAHHHAAPVKIEKSHQQQQHQHHQQHHHMQAAPAPPTSSTKKRQVKFAPIVYEYPFFGAGLPKTSKLIALKCLDFLEGKDIYSMSQVNSLWNSAAMDDALWE